MAVAALGAVAYVVADRCCPTRTDYFAVRVGPGAEYYFRVRGSELRVARTLQQLRIVAPVRATPAGDTGLAWAAEAQLTPGRGAAEWEKVHVSILATEPLPERRAIEKPSVIVDLGLPTEDREGHRWVYWVRSRLPAQSDPANLPWIRVPDRGHPSLHIISQSLPLHRMGLALDLRLGGLQVMSITRDGQTVHARLAVSTETGQLVDSTRGALSNFGTSDEVPVYSVSVRRSRTYVTKAALDAGPLGKVTATSTNLLPPGTTRSQGYCPSLPCTP